MNRGREIDTIPLFAEPEHVTQAEKPKPLKSVDSALCPAHGRHAVIDQRPTGIVRHGGHLHWRDHSVETWGGSKRPCVAANQPLHGFPPRDGYPPCPCGAKPANEPQETP